MKIYGPYLRKDNRQHIIIVHPDGRKQTKSYPRYIMEVHLGRELTQIETIDHINADFTDNRLENLQILTLSENVHKHHLAHPRKQYTFTCPNCQQTATKFLNDVQGNRKKGKAGPFCSRKCAGQYTYKNPWT